MDFLSNYIFALTNLHLFGNSYLGFLYLFVFFSLFREIAAKPALRNFLATSMASLFLMISFAFLSQAVFTPAWQAPWIEITWNITAVFPAIFFLHLRRKHAFILSKKEVLESTERFDKLKHEFVSVASHELRTPLSVINGFAEILVREKLGPLNDEQKRRVRKILLQGQRLNHIIDELLDLSRIRSGKVEVRQDVFDLVPVLKACLDDHQIVCEQGQIQLIDKLPDVLPDAIGDIERITQIIVNLLNNAIKYNDIGGTVTLIAVHEKEKNRVRIEVSDTGIGIDSEDQPRIFEEFYRASQKHSKKYSGSGLGLAIVKQLVESMKGEVGVKSEGLGKGSTFYFTLPVAKSQSPRSPVPIVKPLIQKAS